MKKLFKKNLVLVMLFTMLCSHATDITSLSNIEDGKTRLLLTNVKQGEKLTIKDFSGIILYKEIISNDGNYSKAFDLTELPDGNYFFELDKQLKVQIIPFKVTFNNVKFNKNEEIVIYKPFVKVSNNFLYITQLALNKESLKIELFYNNELIFSETIENTMDIQRAYKLLKDKKDAYKLVFKTNGRIFEEKIKL